MTDQASFAFVQVLHTFTGDFGDAHPPKQPVQRKRFGSSCVEHFT
jgi:hypothetical protein